MSVTIYPRTGGIGGTTGANDNRLIRADGTGGQTVKSSPISCDDSGNLTGVGTINGFTQILSSYLANTVTYNNTAALADTALSVTVVAGGIYEIELTAYTTNVVRTLKVDFGGTATLTSCIGRWTSLMSVIDVGGISGSMVITNAGDDFLDSNLNGVAGSHTYTFSGSIEVDAGGTFLLRGAQMLADASDTTILQGSTLILTRMS